MNFRTILPNPKTLFPITHQDKTMCIGSCFANNIGSRLEQFHFQTLLNPFGILYNPISISNALERILNQAFYTKNDLFEQNHFWHSFDHHSQFSNIDVTTTLDQINKSLQTASDFIHQTNRLIITLGTAYVYQFVETEQVVANCHKVPAQKFNHFLLDTNQIYDHLSAVLTRLKTKNLQLEVVLTVSPIRHIRLGLVENQRSKSALILATHQLVEKFDFIHYFPAYELVLDDLRDYRFYEVDMIHPNQQAVDYIWERFSSTYFGTETLELNQEIIAIQRASEHKAFHPDSQQHQRFIQTYLEKIDRLEKRYSFLKLDVERNRLRTSLV